MLNLIFGKWPTKLKLKKKIELKIYVKKTCRVKVLVRGYAYKRRKPFKNDCIIIINVLEILVEI